MYYFIGWYCFAVMNLEFLLIMIKLEQDLKWLFGTWLLVTKYILVSDLIHFEIRAQLRMHKSSYNLYNLYGRERTSTSNSLDHVILSLHATFITCSSNLCHSWEGDIITKKWKHLEVQSLYESRCVSSPLLVQYVICFYQYFL